MEWQSGTLELGTFSCDNWEKRWHWEDAAELCLHTLNRETFDVAGFVGSSNGLFDGRPALAHVTRPVRKGQPAAVVCFVEFPTHYVTNTGEEACRSIVDSLPDAFDATKPILCAFDDYDIVVLPVHPTDQAWAGAVYRLRTEEISTTVDPADPTGRKEIRRALLANQAIRDRFILDPMSHRADATCYALVSADGDTSLSVSDCTFAGLVTTPSPEVSANLLREMRPGSTATRSVM
jgi:hypothetical protein